MHPAPAVRRPRLPTSGRRPAGPGDLLAGRSARRALRPRRRQARRALVALVVVAGVISTVAAEQRQRAWRPTVEVVVATADLGAGTPLEGAAVRRRRIPAALAPARPLPPPTADAPTGTLQRPVGAGEVVVVDDVAEPGRTGLAAALDGDRRAMAVPVVAAPALEVGQRVDLLGPDLVVARAAPVLAVDEDLGQVTVAVTAAEAAGVARALAAAPLVAALRG